LAILRRIVKPNRYTATIVVIVEVFHFFQPLHHPYVAIGFSSNPLESLRCGGVAV
jgi:hypothetical protein